MEKAAMAHVPENEQETIIGWTRGDERAEVYASDRTTLTKLDRLAAMPGGEWRHEGDSTQGGEVVGRFYSCPADFISFRTKRAEPNLSDEQRQALSERARKNFGAARRPPSEESNGKSNDHRV